MSVANAPSALVLFSGGQDSTTALVWALERYAGVETVGFHYGQRHGVEMTQRPVILEALRGLSPDYRTRLGEDHVIDLTGFGAIGETALTSDAEITFADTGLPTTFVPGRNLAFFTAAAALGYRRGMSVLVGGMCETDYSGYPDCRRDTLEALQSALSLGLATPMTLESPLMWIDKAGTFALAHDLGGDALLDIVLEHTHTCYLGGRDQRHAWGYGCGTCPACELRRAGWERWQGKGA